MAWRRLAVAAAMSGERLEVGDITRVHIRGLAAGGAGIADLRRQTEGKSRTQVYEYILGQLE